MNKIMLIGNLTRDPEIRTTNSGVPVCTFSLAVSRPLVNSDGNRETDFINIVVWRALAENCHKYLRKGSKAAVFGYLQIRNYETKEGQKRTVAEVVANDVEFVGAKRSDDSADDYPASSDEQAPASTDAVVELEPIDDGELPF